MKVQNIKKSYTKSVGAPQRTLPVRLQRTTPVKVQPSVPSYADVELVTDYSDIQHDDPYPTALPPPLTAEEEEELMLPENQAVLNNGAPFWTVGDLKKNQLHIFM